MAAGQKVYVADKETLDKVYNILSARSEEHTSELQSQR